MDHSLPTTYLVYLVSRCQVIVLYSRLKGKAYACALVSNELDTVLSVLSKPCYF